MGDVDQMRSLLWEEDHPEMQMNQGISKETPEAGIEFTSHNDTSVEPSLNHNVESWSLVLYLICFLVLILFFLMISVMEVCCKRAVTNMAPVETPNTEVAPPPYDLFAPPTYDSLYDSEMEKKKKKRDVCKIFVIHLPKKKLSFNLTGRGNGTDGRTEISPPPPP